MNYKKEVKINYYLYIYYILYNYFQLVFIHYYLYIHAYILFKHFNVLIMIIINHSLILVIYIFG